MPAGGAGDVASSSMPFCQELGQALEERDVDRGMHTEDVDVQMGIYYMRIYYPLTSQVELYR